MVIIIFIFCLSIIPSTNKVAETLYSEHKCGFIAVSHLIFNPLGQNNSPPYAPIPDIPDPAPIDVDICWFGGDPDPEDNVTYHLYFGEFDPLQDPPLIAIVGPYPANYTYICYDLEELLDFATKYYLKIDAFDNHNAYNSSGLWVIITEENKPPNPAYNPIPPDNATQVPLDVILYWNGSDPNSGDILTYDVYFGPNPDPPKVKHNISQNYYDPDGYLPMFEDFYWKIVTRDMRGEETEGPEWNFTTYIPWPPPTPEIEGPTRGRPGIIYYYNFTIGDYDEYSLLLLIDWGDDTQTTVGIEPGQTITVGHIWENKGIYSITARTRDVHGCESGIGILKVIIPRYKATINSCFYWFLERFSMLGRLLVILK